MSLRKMEEVVERVDFGAPTKLVLEKSVGYYGEVVIGEPRLKKTLAYLQELKAMYGEDVTVEVAIGLDEPTTEFEQRLEIVCQSLRVPVAVLKGENGFLVPHSPRPPELYKQMCHMRDQINAYVALQPLNEDDCKPDAVVEQ